MIYALHRSAEALRQDIERYGIEVNAEAGTIIWQNQVTTLKPYTPSTICKREIRKYIRAAKEQEKAKQQENQLGLL